MMKAGKRILSLVLLVVSMTAGPLALTGCHGSKGLGAFHMPEEFGLSGNYEITFWAKNDTNKTQTAIYEQAIVDFEKLYPNITVNLRLYTDYGKIYNDVITNITTNTTPNVCITYPDHIATYLTGVNQVVPLEELFSDEKYGLGGSEAVEKLDSDFAQEREISDEYSYHTCLFSDKAPADGGELFPRTGKGAEKSWTSGDHPELRHVFCQMYQRMDCL